MRKTTTSKKVGQARKLPVVQRCTCTANEQLAIAAEVIAELIARIYPGTIIAVKINDGQEAR